MYISHISHNLAHCSVGRRHSVELDALPANAACITRMMTDDIHTRSCRYRLCKVLRVMPWSGSPERSLGFTCCMHIGGEEPKYMHISFVSCGRSPMI